MTAVVEQLVTGDAASYVTALLAGDLFPDPAYQRDIDAGRVASMAAVFDRRLLGVLEVSDRGDGTYAILDGQHRHQVVLDVLDDTAVLVCRVYEGLSLQDEARLFHEINARRKALSWWDRWRARRGAGDEQVAAIDAVLAVHGLQVHPSAVDGNVRATRALEDIQERAGVELLDAVLGVLVAGFGRSPDALDGALLQGVANVLLTYTSVGELDRVRLVQALAGIPPRQVRARATALREAHRGTLPRLCAAVIVERYNATRGEGRRLEEFLTRVPQHTKRAGTLTGRHGPRRAHDAEVRAGGTQPHPPTDPPPADHAAAAASDPDRHSAAASLRAGELARRRELAAAGLCRCGHGPHSHDAEPGGGRGLCGKCDWCTGFEVPQVQP